MIIEVTGTNTWNKGAELMLVAVRQAFQPYRYVDLAVDQFFGSYNEKAKYGLLQKIAIKSFGRARLALNLLPDTFLDSFGLINDQHVDAILDASGFAFGDQHPAQRIIGFAERVEKAKKEGKYVILLPQAMGPFEKKEHRAAFQKIFHNSDLVFARDPKSMEYAQDVVGTHNSLKLAPDFTNMVKPVLSKTSEESNIASIVPNQRMIEKAESEKEMEQYIILLKKIIRYVKKTDLEPVLLLHGDDDKRIASKLQNELDTLQFHDEDDPIKLKKFIGESHILIGSRFHALVSALSQSVPAIGTSWSHKYEMLFSEYNCNDLLLKVSASDKLVEDSIGAVTNERSRMKIRQRLQSAGEKVHSEVREMWEMVHTHLQLEESAE